MLARQPTDLIREIQARGQSDRVQRVLLEKCGRDNRPEFLPFVGILGESRPLNGKSAVQFSRHHIDQPLAVTHHQQVALRHQQPQSARDADFERLGDQQLISFVQDFFQLLRSPGHVFRQRRNGPKNPQLRGALVHMP